METLNSLHHNMRIIDLDNFPKTLDKDLPDGYKILQYPSKLPSLTDPEWQEDFWPFDSNPKACTIITLYVGFCTYNLRVLLFMFSMKHVENICFYVYQQFFQAFIQNIWTRPFLCHNLLMICFAKLQKNKS